MTIQFLALKGKFKNDGPAYILGNGPSINTLNIPVLTDKNKTNTFFVNRGYNISNNFNPKFYAVSDIQSFREHQEDYMAVQADYCLFREDVYSKAGGDYYDFLQKSPIHYCVPYARERFIERHGISDHGQKTFKLHRGSTVVLDCVQMAAFFGFKKIYVGGVDLDYTGDPYFFTNKKSEGPKQKPPLDRVVEGFYKIKRILKNKYDISLYKITESPNLSSLSYKTIEGINR